MKCMSKRFSNTKPMSQKNIDDVPGDKPGVYRIKNTSGKVLYVGTAKGGRLDDRIAEHMGNIKGGTHFQYKTVSSKESAVRLERKEIKKSTPPFNDK